MSVLLTHAESARVALCDLLVAYLRGDDDARELFPIAAHEVLTRLARYHARFLPDDIRAEVVSEAHLILLQRHDAKFDASRAEARVYLRLIVRDAVKRVAASYSPPGSRTRLVKKCGERSQVLNCDDLTIRNKLVVPDIAPASDHRCDVETLLRVAPSGVGSMLRRMYLHGVPDGVVAHEHGVSRFTMARMITKFCSSMAA